MIFLNRISVGLFLLFLDFLFVEKNLFDKKETLISAKIKPN